MILIINDFVKKPGIADVNPGTYYFGAYADYNSLISESNEYNNGRASQNTIIIGPGGASAMHCVSSKDLNKDPKLTNNCNTEIFIIYCHPNNGTRSCGTGKDGGFYTHATNIAPGKTSSFYTGYPSGAYGFKYGACIGSIGFTNNGNFKDYPDGSFTCLR